MLASKMIVGVILTILRNTLQSFKRMQYIVFDRFNDWVKNGNNRHGSIPNRTIPKASIIDFNSYLAWL